MITKYEKEIEVDVLVAGQISKEMKSVECEKTEATYKHICGHDTNPPTPCRRERIK